MITHKPTIMHILPHVRQIGNGTVNIALGLVWALSKNKCNVTVASEGGEFTSFLNDHDIPHYYWKRATTFKSLRQSTNDLGHIIANHSPDIVHVHTTIGVLQASLLRKTANFTLLATAHTSFLTTTPLLWLADKCIPVSKAVEEVMRHRGIPTAKMQTIYNGPLGSPLEQNKLNVNDGCTRRPALLTVAGMYQRKGIEDLIAAFEVVGKSNPDVHLYLVGDGPDVQKLKRKAKA